MNGIYRKEARPTIDKQGRKLPTPAYENQIFFF
jgi:hypothetical protein